MRKDELSAPQLALAEIAEDTTNVDDEDFYEPEPYRPGDRKTSYDWKVIEDPEDCFLGGRFRWIDLQKSAEALTWPEGIRFENVKTGRVLVFDGRHLQEAEKRSNGSEAPQPQVNKRGSHFHVYIWGGAVNMDINRW